MLFEPEPNNPNNLIELGVGNNTTPWVYLYTDYTNIATVFNCAVDNSRIIPVVQRNFIIAIRNRTFDSLSKFMAAVEPLLNLGVDLSNINFYYQGPNCKN